MAKKKISDVKKWKDFVNLLDDSVEGETYNLSANLHKIEIKVIKLERKWQRKPKF